ncbi:hypothetical protein [Candidatus Protochlamydia phocaeensis]|uniref:hypothetical protein n=1 Tax=Candidatus Protochlamydia phocaeensis TaxID=1414722 RepID=UPI0008390CA2|nr:hypothetical protein [Candidatus Protochlamydia phocaeensis]
MRIVGFNPQISVETFQTFVQSQACEEEVKQVAFAALAKNKLEDLTKGLSLELTTKIQNYANERAQHITACIRQLNQLGDCRDDLLSLSADYRESKKALEKAQEAFFAFHTLDSHATEQIEKDLESKNEKIAAKIKKFEKAYNNCVAQSPIASVIQASDELDSLLKQDSSDFQAEGLNEEEQKIISAREKAKEQAIAHLNLTLTAFFVEGLPFSNLKDINTYFNSTQRFLEIFNEQVLIAEKKAKELLLKKEVEKQDKTEANRSILLEKLGSYHSFYERLLLDDRYQGYCLKKKEAYSQLTQLSGFCLLSELIQHPKTTTETKNKLYRTIQVINN